MLTASHAEQGRLLYNVISHYNMNYRSQRVGLHYILVPALAPKISILIIFQSAQFRIVII